MGASGLWLMLMTQPAVLHADLILHGARDTDIDNVIGLDGSAGLTDLSLMRRPSHVHRGREAAT